MHAKSDVERSVVHEKKRKEGGRGRSSVEHVVRGEENNLRHCFKLKRNFLRDVCVAGAIKTEAAAAANESKKQRAEERKQIFLEKLA